MANGKWHRRMARIFGRRRLTLAAVQTIEEKELRGMFRSVPDSPGWKATLAVVDALTVEVNNRALAGGLSEAELREHLGGVQGLLELRAELERREMEARRAEEEPERCA
jgi:hypothetical protein